MKTDEPPVADDQHQSQIAASLRLSEAKLAGILASAMDAIITVDEDQRVVLFNAAAEKMFRCQAAEALGASLDRFIPERFRAAHREPILEVHTKDSPRAVEVLQGAPGVLQAGMFGRAVHLTVDDVAAARRALPGLLTSHGIALEDAELPQIPPSLEDVFISLVRAAGGAVVS